MGNVWAVKGATNTYRISSTVRMVYCYLVQFQDNFIFHTFWGDAPGSMHAPTYGKDAKVCDCIRGTMVERRAMIAEDCGMCRIFSDDILCKN